MAPFGLADAPLQVMASALELIAEIGAVFGDRPEAVRALPRPPDGAFILCVCALSWACLWRGFLRWGGLAFLVASLWLYLTTPQPVAAFDGDLRAMFVRTDETARWTLIASGGRSTYARDKLAAMLGLSPPTIERLAPPEACGEMVCTQRTPAGREILLFRRAEAFEAACAPAAHVIAATPAPPSYAARCPQTHVIDIRNIALLGGALIYETPRGLIITRARPAMSFFASGVCAAHSMPA